MTTSPQTPDQAIDCILNAVAISCHTVNITLASASGHILADNITTDRDSPPFNASSMDGFAVDLALLRAGCTPIVAESRIGHAPPNITSATSFAVRVATGAAVPSACNCVIKHELIESVTQTEITLSQATIDACKPGQAIRTRAENARAGILLPTAGLEITAPITALLAATGHNIINVRAPLTVAILTTGDELVAPPHHPGNYAIRNSSGPALHTLLARRPWLAISPYTHAPDDPEATITIARKLLATHSILIVTGGVSMGHRDFVPALVPALQGSLIFNTLPQRPGKPLLAASLPASKLLFALPGNPQSTLVTARRIVIPTLARLCSIALTAHHTTIANPDDRTLDLHWYRHVRHTSLLHDRGSGDLIAAANSTGFIEQFASQSLACPAPYYPWDW